MKKILSIVLTLAIFVMVMPFGVFAAETSATITFDDSSKAQWSTEQQLWQENGITVTNNKATSTTNIDVSKKYSNPARFYAKSELIVEYPGMTKIDVAVDAAKYVSPLTDSISDSNATVTTSGNTVTIVFTNAVDSFTVATLTSQVRVDSITVYAASADVDPEEPVDPPVEPEEPEEPENNDPAADSELTIEEVLALGNSKEHNVYTDGKYYVTGVIESVYNTQYGNMYIVDEAGNRLTIYGTYDADGTNRYDAMENAPVAGDTVKLYGVVGKYNSTPQMKNAWIIEVVKGEAPEEPEVKDPAADSTLTIEEAIALGASKTHNVYTEGKYYVSGVITEVYNTQYGNMKITDDAGNILTVYGTYDADGTNRYDAMENAPVAGDTVKLYGIIGQYNGTPQLKNAWIVEVVKGEAPVDPPVEPEVPELPAPDDSNTLTVKEALDLGVAQEDSAYTAEKYYVTGKIVAITSDMYGNMYLADEEGNEILVYGTYGADGKDRYDALESKPDEGDTVTVYGVVGNYKGTAQLKNAWIIEFTEGELEEPEVKDPEADSVLSIEDAIALALSKRHNVFTENKYYVTGEILEVYDEVYGNMRIKDAAGNVLTIYGSWNEDGTIGYADMETKPQVGDTVTLYGIIGQYNGTAQMKNGWFTSAPVADDDTSNNEGSTPDTDNKNDTTGDTNTGNTNDNNASTGTTSPVTGDSLGACVAMAIAAGAVILYTNKKR